jgi:hypothetical protein
MLLTPWKVSTLGKAQHCLERYLGRISQDPTASKSNWLHVDFTFVWFSLLIRGTFSIDSSKMISYLPFVLISNWVFLKLNRFICNWQLVH